MNTEQIKERYNEIMFDERDIIVEFLKAQADNRYGHQKYEYAIEPKKLHTSSGSGKVSVSGVVLDDNENLFIATSLGWLDYACFDYGELTKIIDVLPDAEKLVKQTAYEDFASWCKECKDGEVHLEGNPFVWYDGDSIFEVHDIFVDKDGKLNFEIQEIIRKDNGRHSTGWGIWYDLAPEIAKRLRDHVAAELLRRSNEYKKLKEQMAGVGNVYNFSDHGTVGQVEITINGTDINVAVLDVCYDNEKLNVLVDASNTGLVLHGEDYLTLKECDLNEKNLAEIVAFFGKNINIIDAYNGHNPELVEKINKAWNDPKYVDRFGVILLALLTRDQKEYEDTFNTVAKLTRDYAIDHAHEIMEGVGDDWDLETILSFIRYE